MNKVILKCCMAMAMLLLCGISFGNTIEALSLTASSANNDERDDLSSVYTLAGTATTAATAWYRNGNPLMALYLPFEGGEANAPLDYSGNLSNGILGSSVVWAANGGYDGHGTYEFDGSGDAAIDYGQSMPAGAYTKSSWVKRTGDGWNNILSGYSNHAFWAPGAKLSAGHNKSWYIVQDSDPLVLDTWHFVAVTYDPASNGGEMVLYKDGQEVDRATGVAPVSGDPGVWVGAYSGGYTWNGALDDVRIYGLALSGEQIAVLYDNGQNRIVHTETQAGDQWQVQVTPFSSSGAGASSVSNVLTIQASPPLALDRLEIGGPENVAENATATYDATAHYTDGSSAALVPDSWGVDCPSFAAITGGVLTTYGVDADTSCTVSASYTQGGVTVTAEHLLTIRDGIFSGTEMSIMPLGDSITLGIGGVDLRAYRLYLYDALYEHGHLVNFVGSLQDGPSDFDRDHEGHSGWRANNIRDNVFDWLFISPVDVILLHIGTNDINAGESVASTAGEIEEILDEIDRYETDYGQEITVFVARIINRSDPFSEFGLRTSGLNQQINAIVDRRRQNGDILYIVDHESALIYPDDLSDTLHPNDAGYQKMSDVWLNTFLSVF